MKFKLRQLSLIHILLFIKCNSIIISGHAHGIVTKHLHKTMAWGGRSWFVWGEACRGWCGQCGVGGGGVGGEWGQGLRVRICVQIPVQIAPIFVRIYEQTFGYVKL